MLNSENEKWVAFCRITMGWEDVLASTAKEGRTIAVFNNGEKSPDLKARDWILEPADLSAVLDAVRGWCDANNASAILQYLRHVNGYCASIHGFRSDGVLDYLKSSGIESSACIALRDAVLAASDKLQQGRDAL
jgi:hypothetical protein